MDYGDSQGNCIENYAYPLNLRKEMTKAWNEFTINWGSGFENPIVGGGNYQVYQHKSDQAYMFVNGNNVVTHIG
jgi:hypothetical protein